MVAEARAVAPVAIKSSTIITLSYLLGEFVSTSTIAIVEVHKNSLNKNDKVIIVDDLIATGGTALASAKIVEKCKAKVSAFLFLIDLFDLPGNSKLLSKGYKTFKLIDFPGH